MPDDSKNVGDAASQIGGGIGRSLSDGWRKMARDQEERIELAGEYTAELVRISGLALAGIGFLLSRATEKLDGSATRLIHFDHVVTKVSFTIATLAFAGVFFGAVMERSNLRKVIFRLLHIADRMKQAERDGVDYTTDQQDKDDKAVKRHQGRALLWSNVSMACVSIGAFLLAIAFVYAVWNK